MNAVQLLLPLINNSVQKLHALLDCGVSPDEDLEVLSDSFSSSHTR